MKVVSPPANFMGSLPSVLDAVATAGIVIVFTFFMLLQREDLRNRFIRLAGQGRLKVMTQALDEAAQRVSRYLLLQSLVNVSYGVIIGVALYFLKIPNALLMGRHSRNPSISAVYWAAPRCIFSRGSFSCCF